MAETGSFDTGCDSGREIVSASNNPLDASGVTLARSTAFGSEAANALRSMSPESSFVAAPSGSFFTVADRLAALRDDGVAGE
jgi:hypothetical protein